MGKFIADAAEYDVLMSSLEGILDEVDKIPGREDQGSPKSNIRDLVQSCFWVLNLRRQEGKTRKVVR